jgi:hypothetical protein
MDKSFWDKIAQLWCNTISEERINAAIIAAKNDSKKGSSFKTSYNRNPFLDMMDDDEDDDE